MAFHLGERSRKELEEVQPVLVEVVELAISTTPVDFAVHDGIRTVEEQQLLVDSGASFTMRSMHLPGLAGLGRAVDLVPYIAGKLRWDWEPIFFIATVMREAALSLGIEIRWGGAWDMLLTDPVSLEPREMLNMYAARRQKARKRVFLDGPHYELLRAEYPDGTSETQTQVEDATATKCRQQD